MLWGHATEAADCSDRTCSMTCRKRSPDCLQLDLPQFTCCSPVHAAPVLVARNRAKALSQVLGVLDEGPGHLAQGDWGTRRVGCQRTGTGWQAKDG